jgi:hypothetical protein
MNGLWAAALARPLDSAQGIWELSHDFVARAVSRYLGRRRLNWPAIVRGYAAPALFGLMAAAAVGAIAWNATAADRIRAQLADYGIDVSQDQLEATVSPRFKAENWAKAGTLLGKLTALQWLNLAFTQVADLGPIEGLTALRSLDLTATKVTDLGPLKGLTALQSLNLAFTPVAGFGPLMGLTALQSLNLAGTKVVDLGPLKGLTALRSLDLTATKVTDLGPLKGLTALLLLNLSNTHVADLGPLRGLAALQSLDLSDSQGGDLGTLHSLTALQSLNLSRTDIADLGLLRDLPNLREVFGVPDASLQMLNTYRAQNGLPAIHK